MFQKIYHQDNDWNTALYVRGENPCFDRLWLDVGTSVQGRLFLLENVAVKNKSNNLFHVL